MVFIREGIDTLKCGPIIQDLAIDEDIRGLDLDDIVLQSDQAFDVEIAAGRGWDWQRFMESSNSIMAGFMSPAV